MSFVVVFPKHKIVVNSKKIKNDLIKKYEITDRLGLYVYSKNEISKLKDDDDDAALKKDFIFDDDILSPSLSRSPKKVMEHIEKITFPMSIKKINFYHRHEPFYEFTNFYMESPVKIAPYEDIKKNGKKAKKWNWYSTEHYFQAMKYKSVKKMKQVQLLETPREAFQFSRKHKMERDDWELIKDAIMEIALYHKFTQHKNLKKLLKMTGDSLLVEHTSNDSYWGDGGNGSGLNRLGCLLMKVRNEI